MRRETAFTRNRKQVIYVVITSFATSSTHIYPIEGCFKILKSIYEFFFEEERLSLKT